MRSRSSSIPHSLLVVDSSCGHNWYPCCRQMGQSWRMWWTVCSAFLQSQSAKSMMPIRFRCARRLQCAGYCGLLMSCQAADWVCRGSMARLLVLCNPRGRGRGGGMGRVKGRRRRALFLSTACANSGIAMSACTFTRLRLPTSSALSPDGDFGCLGWVVVRSAGHGHFPCFMVVR